MGLILLHIFGIMRAHIPTVLSAEKRASKFYIPYIHQAGFPYPFPPPSLFFGALVLAVF